MLNRLVALAGESDIKPVVDALKTGMGSAKSETLDAIAAILPYALAIMIAVTVVGVGYRIFKKFSH